MAKRKPLSFDSDQLTKDLKRSAGKGVDALFTPSPQTQEAKPPVAEKQTLPTPTKKQIKTIKKESKQYDNIASNITILQFTDEEIEGLREPTYKAQTFRLTEKDSEWIKDTAYRLSKEIKRGKVSQADILKISFRLFENLLAIKKADLIKILERIK